MEKIYQISDNIHGLISCSRLERELISSVPFNRLHYILQNSTAFKTFPSNQTSRLSHSLGAMSIAGKMIYSSVLNSDEQVLTELEKRMSVEMKNIVKSNQEFLRQSGLGDILQPWIACKVDKLPFPVTDEFYKIYNLSSIDSNKQQFYIVLFQSIRAAALLHDIGHPPFSHIVEFALGKLYEEYSQIEENDRNERINDFLSTLNDYKQPRLNSDLHEEIGKTLASRVFENIFKKTALVNKEEAIFVYFIWKFTTKILESKSLTEIKADTDKYEPFYSDLHEIISGHMDCDRLDYVVRDVSNSGFNKGAIEYDRLIKSSKLQYGEFSSNFKESFFISYDIRCLNTVEDFLRRRWNLYKELIYHHRVRKTDGLLEKLVYQISKEYLDQNDKDEQYDGKHALPIDISGLWKALQVFYTDKDLFNSTIQWKDNWLISALEKYYFDGNQTNVIINGMLSEFLKNEKVYFSRIKRMSDFDTLDMNLKQIMNTLLDTSPHLKSYFIDDKLDNERFFFRNNIEKVFNLHKVSFKKSNISLDKILEDTQKEMIKQLNITDSLLIMNKSKNAEQFKIYFHDKQNCKLIQEHSSIKTELEISEKAYPAFYLFTTDLDCDDNKTNKTLEVFASVMCNKIIECLESYHCETQASS